MAARQEHRRRITSLLVGIILGAAFVVVISLSITSPPPPSTPLTSADKVRIQSGTIGPAKTFTDLLLPLIPETVVDLQGEAETHQGYAAYLRFQADNNTINRIIATGFRSVTEPPRSLLVQLHTPPTFSPPWNPHAIAEPEYYEDDVQNGWTHSGKHYLIIDRTNGVVYFIGGGS